MPVNQQELMKVAVELSEERNLQVTIIESGKGACIAGGGALLGGLFGGPVGLAIGGTLGSILAAWNGSGKFKSVAEVILEDMTPTQRENLANAIKIALQDVSWEDAVQLTTLIMTNDSLKLLLMNEICKYLKNEMGLRVIM
ncbi:hypothetical protein PPYR_01560 [Photinus pyralis]|uniref:Uncharacterized protein n=1 Tax=Photinus pyralis TaxID=7054 RepID=A0A1Y1N206_PHOPY|nr:protein C19orf12 homolog [Photinus pyralis]XP_031358933.1 protein C19orf12 homolog [Photinus pyralis]KAB0790213.1 hypothetical protein PPYR_15459 [Photinus pyralis]KAB0804590.1 hypothetical protein PPYR_01560 [Photinus pyralis]